MALDLEARYGSAANSASADYPEGSFKNDVTPGDGSGTPLDAAYLNDFLGFFQRLLAQAGLPANGAIDTALASQYYEALRVVPAQVIAGATGLSRIYLLDNPGILAASITTAFTVNTSVTVGPTGSGATLDGAAYGFNSIPVGARAALVRVISDLRVTAPSVSTAYSLAGGAGSVDNALQSFNALCQYTTNGTADQPAIQMRDERTGWVGLNSSRQVSVQWLATGTATSQAVYLQVLGYAF